MKLSKNYKRRQLTRQKSIPFRTLPIRWLAHTILPSMVLFHCGLTLWIACVCARERVILMYVSLFVCFSKCHHRFAFWAVLIDRCFNTAKRTADVVSDFCCNKQTITSCFPCTFFRMQILVSLKKTDLWHRFQPLILFPSNELELVRWRRIKNSRNWSNVAKNVAWNLLRNDLKKGQFRDINQ